MEPSFVDVQMRYRKVPLLRPKDFGYFLLAAEVHPPWRPGPVLFTRPSKKKLLRALKWLALRLEKVPSVEEVTVLRAEVFAPPSMRLDASVPRPRFDVAVLVETSLHETLADVQQSEAFGDLERVLRAGSRRVERIAARNARRMGDVEKKASGHFLLNFFMGDDRQRVVSLWEQLAGWFAVETGLDNSELLVPFAGDGSEFAAINFARFDISPLALVLKQARTPSFRSYVLGILEANRVVSMPVLYRLA